MMNPRFFLIVTAILLTACARNNSTAVIDGGRNETGQPAMHVIHNEELHELMTRMDSLLHERFMTETELDGERRKFARRIAESALSLSKTVDRIISKMPDLSLTPDEQATFLALANKLHQQTEQLHALASQNHIDSLSDNLHQIETTCISCHSLFRKIGG